MQLILEAKRFFISFILLHAAISANKPVCAGKVCEVTTVVNSLASYLVNLFTRQFVISLTRKLFHSSAHQLFHLFIKKGLVKQASYVTS